jgi:hypothetical protein
MTAAIGSHPGPNTAGTAYGLANAIAKKTAAAAKAATTHSSSGSDSVTLSDAAKAYLAAAASSDGSNLATKARSWFDQQYQTLGIGSAMLDGEVAVDLTGQSRATLSVVAANAHGVFSTDESAAAGQTLQSRFNDAMTPQTVIARHTGDYAGLYQAASDYLDRAGPEERATAIWQSQNQAVQDGLTAAKSAFGKAPDTGNPDDPVRALLDATAQSDATTVTTTDPASVATHARAMLDAQANKARDAGAELVFDKSRKNGQLADFSGFDNQTLAVVALDQGATFSSAESRAAKTELDQRNRASVLKAFDTSNGGSAQDASLALLKQYSSMSDAEKTALGYTDAFRDRIIQNYRTLSTLQNATGSTGTTGSASQRGLAAYI